MPVEQLTPHRAAASGDAQFVQYDQFIDTHIQSTRRAVKLVDLATALVLLASGVLAFLLAVTLVEHWLVPGGFSVVVRTLLFTLLAGGAAYFAYHRLWPLCARAINPVYAARTIEQSSPSLKNTLVNLLLFRQKRGEMSDAVYHTLEEQAAQRLTRVPVEAAVDRSHLIRFGYVLVGVLAVAALYKVASPKDPFITAERVLFPWANIVPASRVQIADIKPGDVTIARGEFIDIAAEVRGIGENDPVSLRYTTVDGQAVSKAIPMKATAGGLRFECRLPDKADATGLVGVGQNLTYRIEAGDARSLNYDVKVITAPAILVQQIEYDYPTYTGFVDRKVDGVGDIRAIEGTRVTIRARANGPIGEAFVDFDADGRRDLPMTTSGADATATFVLSLRDDRQTPKFASYVLRFINAEGRTNRDPVKYPIEVSRDYNPEITLIAPQEKSLDVRLDQTVTIEVDARDPDFGLSEVRLRGESIGRPAINAPLLSTSQVGRFTGKYAFTPKVLQLRAGDVVHYWATASDNRTPTPNTAETEKRSIRIVASDPVQPPPNRGGPNDARRQQPGENPQRGKQPPNNDPQNNGANQDQSGGGDSSSAGGGRGERGANTKPQPGENTNPTQEKQRPNDEPQAKDGGANQGDSGSAGGTQSQQDQPGQQGNPKQQGAPGQGEGGKQGDQSGSESAGGASKTGARPDGGQPNSNSTPSGGKDTQNKTDGNSSPISSKGDNDAEAFREIQEHLERTGELKNDSPPKAAQQNGNPQNGNSQNGNPKDGAPKDGSPQNAAPQNGNRRGGNPPSAAPQNGTSPDGKSEPQTATPDAQTKNGTPGAANPKNQNGDANAAQPNQPAPGARGENGERRGGGNQQQPGDSAKNDGKQPSGQRDGARSSRGGESTSTDPSGKSTPPGDDQRVRDSQSGPKPDERWQQTPSTDPSTKQDKGAPGKRDPNSPGEQGDDLPEGSKDSHLEKPVKRDGTGKTGQGESADKGAGESGEHGPGNTSKDGGHDATSAEKTGQRGNETAGKGSSQHDGEGKEPGGKAGDTQSGEADPNNRTGTVPSRGMRGDDNQTGNDQTANGDPAAAGGSRSQKPDATAAGRKDAGSEKSNTPTNSGNSGKTSTEPGQPGDDQSGAATPNGKVDPTAPKTDRSGTPDGSGGQRGTNTGTPQPAEGEAPDADAANLEYARKQTDLVLEKLSDQLNRKHVDNDLLKKLGWTEDDLRKFIARWNERKEAAKKPDATADAARRDLDEALRSLGLRPGTLKQSQVKDDNNRNVNPGFRGAVPLEYQERLRAYNQGVSRSRQSGGEK